MSEPTISSSQTPSLTPPVASEISGKARRPGDRVFGTLSLVAGGTVLAVMLGIAVFLVVKAIPALRVNSTSFFTTKVWLPDATTSGGKPTFGIAALLFHTLATGFLAMIIAVPVAIGIALFITYYAPRRTSAGLGYFVDLLAAVPS